jgi:hypothetical protein
MAQEVKIKGSDGTNEVNVKVDASGNLISVAGGAAADDAAASGNPVPVGGIYNSTLPTYTNLDRTQAQFSSRGALIVGGEVAGAATDFGNPVKVAGVYNSTSPTLTSGFRGDLQLGVFGSLKCELWAPGGLVPQVAAGDNADGVAVFTGAQALAVRSRNTLFNGTSWDRESKVATVARLLSAAASTNATSVKASAGNVFKIVGVQANAAARFLKLYNKASAPTVGSDTPIATLYLPPTTVNGGIFEFDFGAQPLYFATGIAYALTTAAADADTGALTAADVVAMNLFYT